MLPTVKFELTQFPFQAQSTGFIYNAVKDFGGSSSLAQKIESLVDKPLSIIFICIFAFLIGHIGKITQRKIIRSYSNKASSTTNPTELLKRITTLLTALLHLWTASIWGIAFLLILSVLGLNLAPLLTGATILGATLAFGAQNIVKDYLGGFFLIAENQIAIGEKVQILDVTGKVESISLRTTVLRDDDGILWYFANGDIRKVGKKPPEKA